MDPQSGLPLVTLDANEKNAYRQYFLAADADKDGVLNQTEAVNFMRLSGLDNNLLAQIWTIVNANGQSRLNPNAFSVAMRLISLAQRGVPPSLQALAGQTVPTIQGMGAPAPVAAAPAPGMAGLSPNNPYATANTNSLAAATALAATNPYASIQAPVSPNSPAMTRTQPTNNTWTITPEKRQSFLQMFSAAPKMNPQLMSGAEARTFLLKSGLDQTSLGQIWQLADVDRDSSLSAEEFCIAMHLCHSCLAGTEDFPRSRSRSKSKERMKEKDPWVVSQESQAQYRQYFAQANPVQGRLSATVARDLFLRSGLPNDDLAKVWSLSDLNKDGQLDEREFMVAMHLVNTRRIKNLPIPATLPPQLLQSLVASLVHTSPGHGHAVGGAGFTSSAPGGAMVTVGGGGPSFFGQHSHAQLLAQQEAEQKARKQVAAVQNEIAKRLQSKEEIINKLRQIQESNLKLARDLSVKAQAINRAGVAIAAMETYGKQQLLRNDALNKLQEGIRQTATPLFEYKQMLGKIFEERQSAVNAEQERQAVLEGQIDQAKGLVQQQKLDIAKLQSEIQTLVQQKQLEAQRKAELAAKKAAEEELARRKASRLAEEKRIAQAKAELEKQKKALELAKQKALMEAQAAAQRVVEAEERERMAAAQKAQEKAAAAQARTIPDLREQEKARADRVAATGGQYLDMHQANQVYTEYADDFGTPSGSAGGGPADFYYTAGHPQYSPGFFPENPDYGSVFALGIPQQQQQPPQNGPITSPSSPEMSRTGYDSDSSSSSEVNDIAQAATPAPADDELDELFAAGNTASSPTFNPFDAPLFDD